MSELPIVPNRRIKTDKLIELAAPFAHGQRGLVIAPARSGATTLLQRLTRAFHEDNPSGSIQILLVDRPVEDQLEWRYQFPGAQIFVNKHEAALNETNSASEGGNDSLLIIDSLSALARRLLASDDSHAELAEDSGLSHAVRHTLRTIFASARAFDTKTSPKGSVTLVGSLLTESAMELDHQVHHELVGTGNAEWVLRSDAAKIGLHPALCLASSGARYSERIVGAEKAERDALIRASVLQRGELGALELLLHSFPQ